jgi:hypothetical protein
MYVVRLKTREDRLITSQLSVAPPLIIIGGSSAKAVRVRTLIIPFIKSTLDKKLIKKSGVP